MKLKLRVDQDDLLIFGIFALFLLYIVAIAILNFKSVLATGTFSGLNPFPAFGPENIKVTIPLYILFLGGIFFAVKSYIFEPDEGIGITTEKKDKGYSRWAKEKEIQNEEFVEEVNIHDKVVKAAGVPLMVKNDRLWVDNGEYHTLVIGSTGSGKTQTVVFPTVKVLARKGESMIITDPKGEIYHKTANMLKDRGYQILILNFRNPQNGNAWNPMAMPYKLYKEGNQDKANELLDDLALNILYDENNKADPFWEKTAADYFSGIALGLFEDAKPDEININSISLATTQGEEKFGSSTYIKEYFGEKDPNSPAAIDASSTIMAPDDTKDSILSVFKQKIKLFASRVNLSEMLSYSDIDLESIGRKKTAVFIVIQDEKKTYHALATIFLKQVYETLIRVAAEYPNGKLPVRTNFILDEFPNMPPLKDCTTMITASRSRDIRFTIIIQNFAQLNQVYGEHDAETIRGNCGNTIYLITSELKALEEISKLCGEQKSKKDDKTASTPLVTISDLQKLKLFDVIVLRSRLNPFKTHFTPDFEMDWGKKYPEAEYPTRKTRKVNVFNIKEFVKKQKKEKLLKMMSEEENRSSRSRNLREEIEMRNREMAASRPSFATRNRPQSSRETTNLPPFITNDLPEREEVSFSKPSSVNRPIPKPKEADEEKTNPGFNVEELVRKIDAKIAEIEREEEEERKKQESAKQSEVKEAKTVEEKPTPVPEPVKQPVSIELDDDDDDEDFFDDFFDN